MVALLQGALIANFAGKQLARQAQGRRFMAGGNKLLMTAEAL